MGFFLAVGALAGTVLAAVLVRLLADECKAWLPWVAERVIRHAIRKLPEHLQKRYSEEWRSHFEEVPGPIGKLISALDFLRAGWKMTELLSQQTSQSPEEPKSVKPGQPVSARITFGTPVPKDDVILAESANDSFRLFIYPVGSGFRLIGHPLDLQMGAARLQRTFSNAEDLVKLLSSTIGLPAAQVEAIRQTAVAGGVQEIGGSHSPVIRLFRRSDLERAGMALASEVQTAP